MVEQSAQARRVSGLLPLTALALVLIGLTWLIAPRYAQQTATLGAAGLAVGLCIAIWAPELLLVLFLIVGQFKDAPIFASLSSIVDLTVLTAVLLIIGSVYALVSRGWKVRIEPLMAATWLLLCVLFLGSLVRTQLSAYGSAKSLQFVTLSSLAFVCPFILLAEGERRRRFLYGLVAFSLAYTLPAVIEGAETRDRMGFVALPGADYLALGRIAGAGLLAALLYLAPQKGIGRALGMSAALILGAGLFLSGGRGPVVAFVLSLLATALAAFLRGNAHERRLATLCGLVMLGLGALFYVGALPATITYRLGELDPRIVGEDVNSTAHIRTVLWRDAATALVERPLLGAGSGQFEQWTDWYPIRGNRVYPHNVPLEVGAELGVAGLAAILLLILYPVGRWAATVRSAVTEDAVAQRTVFLALFVFSWVNAFVTGDVNDNRIAWLSCAALVLACRPRNRELPTGIRTQMHHLPGSRPNLEAELREVP